MADAVLNAKSRTSRKRRPLDIAPYAMIAAAAIYLLLFLALPLLRGLMLSFTDARLLRPNGGDNIGLKNYATIFGGTGLVKSILVTFTYTAGTVIASVVIGTVAALAINRSFPGRSFARSVLVAPWAVPAVAVALVFSWMYNPNSGVFNRIVSGLGGEPQRWLVNPDWALFSVTLASVWKVSPFVMLVILAALQSVPDDLIDAARVDGADGFNRFLHVVLPHILPTIRIVSLLMTVWSIRRFEIIWLLTGGGPVDATNTIVINVYRQAFQSSNLGRAAAIGMVGLLLSVCVTVVYFLIERRSEREDVR